MKRLKLGIVGISEGNGHPFSFSSIINGFSEKGFANSGWDVIYEYLKRRHPSEFGFDGVKISHAWTQDENLTDKLCEACLIPNKVSDLEDMVGIVDGVIIARDDYEQHLKLSQVFLEKNIPVFIDKPLTLNIRELRYFKHYIERGLVMSCSGMRFARELDEPRSSITEFGKIKLIRGTVVNDWEKYAIHVLEAALNVVDAEPVYVIPIHDNHISIAIKMKNGLLVQIDALGNIPITCQIEIWGTRNWGIYELNDNFTAFRRTLKHFIDMVRTGKPPISPQKTISLIRLLIAGKIAKAEKRKVFLKDIMSE